jgi:putative transposase
MGRRGNAAAPLNRAKCHHLSRLNRGERGIWQRRFWEHTIRDEQDYASHLDYVHFNRVKHGFAPSAAAWPYSTFHRAVARGQYARS